MPGAGAEKRVRVAVGIVAGVLVALAATIDASAGVALVRRIEVGATPGIEGPGGIALREAPSAFVVVDSHDAAGARRGRIWTLDLSASGDGGARALASAELALVENEPSGVARRPGRDTSLVLDADTLRLLEVDESGRAVSSLDLAALGARNPEGIAVDADGSRLWIADGRARRVLELTAEGRLAGAFDLDPALFEDAEGIAYDAARDRLFLVSHRSALLAELSRDGELLGAWSLAALGAIRPHGLAIGPSSDPSDDPAATSLYVADAMHRRRPDGRVLELARVQRPAGAPVLTSRFGDVDGFGFRGVEPGFARGDRDHDGLLEPGEQIPARRPWDNRDAADPEVSDATRVVAPGEPLVIRHRLALEDRKPLWARLTVVVADARALPGRRNLVRADGRLLGEVIPTREGRIQAGAIVATVLELPPDSLRELADGELRVEIAREPGSGDDDLMLDHSLLEVAVAP
jgi:hypothetical protein